MRHARVGGVEAVRPTLARPRARLRGRERGEPGVELGERVGPALARRLEVDARLPGERPRPRPRPIAAEFTEHRRRQIERLGDEDGYSELSKDELLEEARERELPGRSTMSRDELISHLRASD